MALAQPLTEALQAIKNTNGAISRGRINTMYLFDPQFRNQFEVIMVPRFSAINNSNVNSKVQSSFLIAEEQNVMSFHLQSVTVPQISYGYERLQEKRYVNEIIHPDNVTMSFIENENGNVKDYIQKLQRLIADRARDGSYVFNDNQEISKRDAIIFTQGGLQQPSTLQYAGWMKLEGLKYETSDEQTLEQSAGDAQIISVTFSIDNAWYFSPST
jgi:hypothetical protein